MGIPLYLETTDLSNQGVFRGDDFEWFKGDSAWVLAVEAMGEIYLAHVWTLIFTKPPSFLNPPKPTISSPWARVGRLAFGLLIQWCPV